MAREALSSCSARRFGSHGFMTCSPYSAHGTAWHTNNVVTNTWMHSRRVIARCAHQIVEEFDAAWHARDLAHRWAVSRKLSGKMLGPKKRVLPNQPGGKSLRLSHVKRTPWHQHLLYIVWLRKSCPDWSAPTELWQQLLHPDLLPDTAAKRRGVCTQAQHALLQGSGYAVAPSRPSI